MAKQHVVYFTPEIEEIFIEQLFLTPNVRAVCNSHGISTMTYYNHKKENPDFEKRAEKALQQGVRINLASAMYERAVDGIDMKANRMYSDTLAIFLAKAHDREFYGDKQDLNVSVQNGESILNEALNRSKQADNDSSSD